MIDLDAWLDSNDPTDGAHWTLNGADGINDKGWITGRGSYNGGLDDAFLLDASSLVPEPSLLALLALAGAGLLRRRRLEA